MGRTATPCWSFCCLLLYKLMMFIRNFIQTHILLSVLNHMTFGIGLGMVRQFKYATQCNFVVILLQRGAEQR